MTTTQPEPWPSFLPLIEFARGARGGQFADELHAALEAARAARWRWQDALTRTAALITDPGARGRGLLHQVQKASRHQPASGPTAEFIERRRALGQRRGDVA